MKDVVIFLGIKLNKRILPHERIKKYPTYMKVTFDIIPQSMRYKRKTRIWQVSKYK